MGGNMQAYLLSAESIAVQISVLNDVVCSGAPDPAGCAKGVEAHWGDIGAAMYPVFLEASSVCGQLGACKKVNELVGEATGADVITFLKGDAYCMGEEGCGGYIDAFMPYAMPVLGATLEPEAEQLCCENSPSGVCC